MDLMAPFIAISLEVCPRVGYHGPERAEVWWTGRPSFQGKAAKE